MKPAEEGPLFLRFNRQRARLDRADAETILVAFCYENLRRTLQSPLLSYFLECLEGAEVQDCCYHMDVGTPDAGEEQICDASFLGLWKFLGLRAGPEAPKAILFPGLHGPGCGPHGRYNSAEIWLQGRITGVLRRLGVQDGWSIRP